MAREFYLLRAGTAAQAAVGATVPVPVKGAFGISCSTGKSADVSSLRGQRAGQLTERFLVSFVRDLRKIPGQFETHTLARANPAFGFI